ncbi:MAG: hypothetical protein KIT10_16080 [Flavobacteriales bacterium]|nr:hypothetical protein [Flavobacteriales bacterium]
MPRFALLLPLMALAACDGGRAVEDPLPADPPAASPELADGLLGEWVSPMSDGRTVFHEQWHRTGNGHLEGLGFVMSGADTVFIEQLGIHFTDSGTWYSATIPSQNGGLPVHFRRTADRDSMVFVNPDHDFPQRIVYRPEEGPGWAVDVSGMERGTPRVERFRFVPRAGEGTSAP